MSSPDLGPDEIQRFLGLGDLGQAPLFLSLRTHALPDTVLNPGITTRDTVAACKKLMVSSGGRQTDFLISEGSMPLFLFLSLGAWVMAQEIRRT